MRLRAYRSNDASINQDSRNEDSVVKSIMLVDDDIAGLRTENLRLKSMGYTVYTAKDAASNPQ